MRKLAIGIRIMKPSTIIDILNLKLYIDYNRQQSRLSQLIKVNEEVAFIHNGVNKSLIEMEKEHRYWNETWTDRIVDILVERDIKIINSFKIATKIIASKTIIDYAVEYK